MGNLVSQDKSIVDIGREFAFEGLGPEYFQAKNAQELEAFNIGYQEGLRIIAEKQAESTKTEDVEIEIVGMKK
ncbi:MAG TPA: hypothetical protein DCE23_09305 [Firmicutes bacterium]|nr:hypothetical protein [Bacillota bacterium]